MKDCTGIEIKIGDRVVHVLNYGGGCSGIRHGTVTRVTPIRVDYEVIAHNELYNPHIIGFCYTPHNVIRVNIEDKND